MARSAAAAAPVRAASRPITTKGEVVMRYNTPFVYEGMSKG